jgi:hypothetical protein
MDDSGVKLCFLLLALLDSEEEGQNMRRFAVLAAVLLSLVSVNVANAQINPTGAGKLESAEDAGLKLQLLYQIPDIETSVRLDASEAFKGNSFSIEDDLNANIELFLPVFAVELNSGGFGRYLLEYSEFRLSGADFLKRPIFFDGVNFPQDAPIRSKYEFRTLGATGIFNLPLDNWIDVSLLVSVRYLQFYTSLKAPRSFAKADDTVESLVPTVGLGLDLFLAEGFYVFGSYQILGYSLGSQKETEFLLLDEDSRVFTRDWRAGVRYQFTPWVAARLEVRSLTLRVRKGKAELRQDYDGLVFGVEVKLF